MKRAENGARKILPVWNQGPFASLLERKIVLFVLNVKCYGEKTLLTVCTDVKSLKTCGLKHFGGLVRLYYFTLAGARLFQSG